MVRPTLQYYWNIARAAGRLYKTALCPVWDSRADKDHGKKKHWPYGTQFLPVAKNIKYVKLVEPDKILFRWPAYSYKTWPNEAI